MSIQPTDKTFKNYLFFWSGQIISLLGSIVVQFIILWWIQLETKNPIYLALAQFFFFLPLLISLPIAGVISDKFSRKNVILTVDFLQALATLALIFLFVFDMITLWIVFIFISLRSLFQGFHQPCVNAIIPTMVPEEKLSRINGINFLFTGLIQLVGPPLAALLFQFFGNNVELVLWVDVITFLIAIIPLLLVKIPQVIDKAEESLINSSFIGDFKVGLKTLTNIPGLVILVLFSMLINFLLRPINILLPYFINSIHGGFSFDYALVEILFNIGIIGGAIVTSIKKQWNRKIQIILLGVILIGFFYGILKFIPTGSFLLIGFTLLLLGLPLPIINSIYQSILQVKVPKDKMGRVLSIDQGISMMFSPLGSIIAGPLAVFMGTQNLFLFCGITMIFLTVLVYFLSNLTHLNYDEVKADMKITIGK